MRVAPPHHAGPGTARPTPWTPARSPSSPRRATGTRLHRRGSIRTRTGAPSNAAANPRARGGWPSRPPPRPRGAEHPVNRNGWHGAWGRRYRDADRWRRRRFFSAQMTRFSVQIVRHGHSHAREARWAAGQPPRAHRPPAPPMRAGAQILHTLNRRLTRRRTTTDRSAPAVGRADPHHSAYPT